MIPENYANRPVAILGGGVLGRRIGCCWVAAGYNVQIRDPSEQQRIDALEYIKDNARSYAESTNKTPGQASAYEDVESAVKNAWIVFEAVPEKLNIKIDTMEELERLAPRDCIIASNSSSYKSSEMLDKVKDETKARIMNTHYFMPPDLRIVELMTCGHTDPALFPFVADRHKEAALIPFIARKESTGFIFNRIWAAIKREALTVMADGVSTPEEIDHMWGLFFGSKVGPCWMMDQVGLDTVQFIENHYIHERGLPTEKTVDFLEENYIKHGKLGNKCSKGGLFPPAVASNKPKVILCELGVSKSFKNMKSPKELLGGGRLLQVSTDGISSKNLVENAGLPDGVDICKKNNRLYFTDMGTFGNNDGRLLSCNPDGSDVQIVLPPGAAHTPKQIAVEESSEKLYFCDREGLRVMRCNLDGSNHEVIVQTGDWTKGENQDLTKWCVGMAVAPKLGKFFWTQKGVSKSGKGRIFSANLEMPEGQTATNRQDIECVLDKLPEPIDLEFYEETNTLYWTDRGEVPFGNSLNRAQLDASGKAQPATSGFFAKHEIIAQNFDEAIGLKLDPKNNSIFVADLGGTLWRCNFDGSGKEKVLENKSNSFTGLVLI